MFPRNINLFILDPSARSLSGPLKCTLANWTGLGFKIPRTDLEKCADRPELKQSGVYFLFGVNDETGEKVVYVGQAGVRKNGEGLLYRFEEHKKNPEKDYWTEAVCFTTSNNTFGPTEISYLENRFCNMAIKAKQYTVKNAVDPNPGNITEEKQSELDDFIEYAKIVMGAFQHNVFEPATGDPEEAKDSAVLHLEHTLKTFGKVEADGLQTAEGFAVLAGSHISPEDGDTIPATVKESRRFAKQTGKIDDNWVLKEDIPFTSPSYAAMFVIGKSANGLTAWKTVEGKTLKQVEDEATVASEE